jgi:hypothetical protein
MNVGYVEGRDLRSRFVVVVIVVVVKVYFVYSVSIDNILMWICEA